MRNLEYGRLAWRRGVRTSIPVGTEEMRLNATEVVAGLGAGLGAGVAMGIMALIVSLFSGLGLWTPFNDVAGIIYPTYMHSTVFHAEAIPVAIGIHFAFAAVLGMLFTAAYASFIKLTFDYGLHITVGVIFGMLTWFLMRFVGLPLSGMDIYTEPAFMTAHAVFGGVLALLYPYVRTALHSRG